VTGALDTGGHRRASSPAVAIVHERITELGGSERVVEALHRIWPDAPVYVPVADPAVVAGVLPGADVRTSTLQRVYRGGRSYAHLLPLLPVAMRQFRFDGTKLVIASHHAFANRVRVRAGVRVISYVHTPARWMWDSSMRNGEAGGRAGQAALRAFALSQRRPDVAAAARADLLLANSSHVARRIERWWGRTAKVVHPPIDTDFFVPGSGARGDFFLLAGRLVPYKRPEVAVAGARRAGVRLVVVGDGRSRPVVEAVAGPGIEMIGSVDRVRLRHLFRTCRALIFPGEEDFGMVPVEAMACGTPVIALRAGGILDTVIDGITGTLLDAGNDECAALADSLRSFDDARFDHARIRRHAEGFSAAVFRDGILDAVGALEDPGNLGGEYGSWPVKDR